MSGLIDYLKNRSVHTPRLAVARLLLALGMLLTLLSNDMSVIANHNYSKLNDYSARHTVSKSVPLKQLDLFMVMPPDTAKIVVIVILLLVMTGMVPQVTAVLHFIACFSYHNYVLVVNGGDEVMFVLSLLLIPLCLSDPRLNQWRHKPVAPSQRNIVGGIALFMIQVQAAFIYLDAGLSKVPEQLWRQGTAVYYYTSHYRLGARGWLQRVNEWVTLSILVKPLTWTVMAFEIVLGLALFFPAKIKHRLFIPAVAFHLFIAINFGLITFFLAMTGMLVLYLGRDAKTNKLA